jgi:hypothetical protein
MFMKDNGKINKEMEGDLNYGMMDQFIKAIGKIILLMDLAALSMPMEISI